MELVLITYTDGCGLIPRTRQHMVVPVLYLEAATRWVTGLWGGRIIETRPPHATNNLVLPDNWALGEEVKQYWNQVQLLKE